MKLIWNDRFEAVLTPGELWQGDMEAVKAAGFKTDGPPAWVWAANKASCLVKLKENRPASGLSISKEALEKFQQLLPEEQKNQALLDMLKERKKEIKKQAKQEERENDIPEYWKGKESIGREDFPIEILSKYNRQPYVPTPIPHLSCIECAGPVYLYEQQDPPLCLWCEKYPIFPDQNIS